MENKNTIMKKKKIFKIATILLIALFSTLNINSQSTGDIAFTAFNFDGEDDFSIVTLVNISPNTSIFFTDNNWNGTTFSNSEGALEWNTGSNLIKSGTIVIFSSVTIDANRTVSIGTLSEPDAGFNLSEGGDTLFAYLGADENTPTTFLTGIRNATLAAGELTGTGLTAGINFIEFNPTASPNAGFYSNSRSDKTAYNLYLPEVIDKTKWTSQTSNGQTTLPISQEIFTINTTNWTGALSGIWNDAGNWDNGVPTSSSLANIPNVTTSPPEISTGINGEVGNLIISDTQEGIDNFGLSLLAGSLTISGNLTIDAGSLLYLESRITASKTIDAASVILKGTYTSGGTNQFSYFTETFNDNTSGWSLISSPTVGESIQEFTTFNELQESTVNTNNFGIAPYNNNGTVWNYYTGATDGTTYGTGSNPLNASGNFTSGIGYSVLPNSGLNADTAKGMLGFKGAIATTDFTGGTAISISDNSGSGGNAFNLIGNPYPSFIFAGSDPAAANEFLDTNKDELAEETLWFWDKTTSSYITVNKTSNRYIAPAQGFFVKAKTGGGSISFTEAMQSHQSSGTFNKTQNTRPEISLQVVNNSVFKTAKIYYYDNKTTGFDNGFDSSIFEGIETDFSVYTKLVSKETNQKLAIQTLPTQDYDTMVIPVEVNGIVNSEINFSANSLNLPKGYNVYLEDKLNNSITNLDLEKYTTTLDESFKENRFFIHTKTSNVLSTENENLQNISIYTTSNANLRISGLKRGKTNVSLFNILGKNVLDSTFEATSIKELSLPNLVKGIYIIKLQNNEGTLTQKIILE